MSPFDADLAGHEGSHRNLGVVVDQHRTCGVEVEGDLHVGRVEVAELDVNESRSGVDVGLDDPVAVGDRFDGEVHPHRRGRNLRIAANFSRSDRAASIHSGLRNA
jgi:hypothetical protein